MGTGNALRATETFTLIQLEEERQKLKKKELLKSMLTDSEFSIKGQCAINLMMTKLDIINTFLLMKYKRNFIQMKTWRLKSYDSVCKKMQKKGLDLNFDLALEKINDLIGVRAVCAYVDDIYKVADLIEKQQDIHILKIKDYVQQPKKSGYQSLHLILEIAIPFQKENQWIKLELQLRTAAMDYWANLDHQLRYKRGQKQAAVINEELQQCHYHVNIPANPEYSSLNVAMAVQTLSYEIRMAWLAQQERSTQVDDDSDYPPQASMELFFQHLEETLYQTQFLHSDRSGHVMMRLRRMFTRMRPDSNELNILRGILTSIQKPPRNS